MSFLYIRIIETKKSRIQNVMDRKYKKTDPDKLEHLLMKMWKREGKVLRNRSVHGLLQLVDISHPNNFYPNAITSKNRSRIP